MLLVNGGLAVLNGLLVMTGKIWCECFRGGICCGGVCYCNTPGVCCDNVWINEDGTSPGLEGLYHCCYDSNGTVIFEVFTPIDVPCGEVIGPRCCENGICTKIDGFVCNGEVLLGSCERFGCPEPCCTEDAEGKISCEIVDSGICSGIVDFVEPTCETACRGACCIDGELTENSPLQQAECDDIGGCWWGVGSTVCGTEGFCQPPFSLDCCESVVSSAQRLTFTGPRRKRCPKLSGCSLEVTVEVKAGSPVFVHGGLFGSSYEACTEEVTFIVCNDEFYVTPANPCSGSLQKTEIEACWDEGSGDELLRFRCCQNIKHLIGNCDCGCATTVLYQDNECTSNAEFVMRGDAAIDSSGTGALTLTEDITHENGCERTLTLQGSNTDDNLFSGSITDGPGTSVDKAGTGSWRLTANSDYAGKLRVLSGTFVVDANIDVIIGGGPFGSATGAALRPEIGGGGTATLLLVGGRTIDRGFSVVAGNGVVTIGMIGSGTAVFGGSMTVRLARDITLQAVDSGTVEFQNRWKDIAGGPNPAFAYNIGSAGNAGTVILGSFLPDTITEVNVHFGTLKLDGGTETIGRDTPVTLGLGSTAVTLDLNGTTQPLASLTFEGANSSTVIGPGTLQMVNAAEIQVTSSGNGTTPEISANVELADPTDVTVLDPGVLTISGVVSGTASLTLNGSGTLTLTNASTLTGTLTVASGSLILNAIVSGSDVASATFSSSALTVDFSSIPSSGSQFVLLAGPTGGTYATVSLTGAGGATGTYNSATSTLTID